MRFTITILIDNRVVDGCDYVCEHGLAMYVECDGATFLVDTGASGAFLENAEKMGVDLSAVDFCVISHGHDDHTGGLRNFLELQSRAKVILSSDIFTHRYFSKSRGDEEEIGIDRGLLDDYLERFNCLDTSSELSSWWVTPEIALVGCGCSKYPRPGGNKTLFKSSLEDSADMVQDDFTHELSIAIKTSEGVVIISSCSHCGAANIIESCLEVTGDNRLKSFIGGLHFTDRSDTLQSDIDEFISYIETNHPEATIWTGHCTGERAKDILARHKQINFFYTGAELT